MRKKHVFRMSLMLIFAMLISACSSQDESGGGKAEEKELVWVLTDQIDTPGKASENSYDTVSYGVEYQPSDYVIRWTYTGETDASRNIMNGETWTGRFTYKNVPDVMVPGEQLVLNYSVVEVENSLLGTWWVDTLSTAYLFYDFGSDPDISDPFMYLRDDNGIYYHIVNTYDEDYQPFNDKKLSAIIPKGVLGNKISLTFNCDFSDAGVLKDQVRTVYRYEMKER